MMFCQMKFCQMKFQYCQMMFRQMKFCQMKIHQIKCLRKKIVNIYIMVKYVLRKSAKQPSQNILNIYIWKPSESLPGLFTDDNHMRHTQVDPNAWAGKKIAADRQGLRSDEEAPSIWADASGDVNLDRRALGCIQIVLDLEGHRLANWAWMRH